MRCPSCNSVHIYVVKTVQENSDSIIRRRTCKICKHNWHTREQLTSARISRSRHGTYIIENEPQQDEKKGAFPRAPLSSLP